MQQLGTPCVLKVVHVVPRSAVGLLVTGSGTNCQLQPERGQPAQWPRGCIYV